MSGYETGDVHDGSTLPEAVAYRPTLCRRRPEAAKIVARGQWQRLPSISGPHCTAMLEVGLHTPCMYPVLRTLSNTTMGRFPHAHALQLPISSQSMWCVCKSMWSTRKKKASVHLVCHSLTKSMYGTHPVNTLLGLFRGHRLRADGNPDTCNHVSAVRVIPVPPVS